MKKEIVQKGLVATLSTDKTSYRITSDSGKKYAYLNRYSIIWEYLNTTCAQFEIISPLIKKCIYQLNK